MRTHILILPFLTFLIHTSLTNAANDCFIAGCHGQLCTDNRSIWTTCDWTDEFTCYPDAFCERQSNGECDWTSTRPFSECLKAINSSYEPCYTGGCFHQICANTPYTSSTCNWVDQYSCYADAKCERQSDGQCNWSSTPELRQCLNNTTPSPAPCYVSGCFNHICSSDPNAWSLCEWKDEYSCYKHNFCERQSNGECGWTPTPEMDECLLSTPDNDACYITGCSSELCTDDPDARSSCEWREWYSCYQNATCQRQSDGKCGWTQTYELNLCLGYDKPDPDKACYVAGCSSEYCTDDLSFQSECGWREWYGCYMNATCERQDHGLCGWTNTPELEKCLENTMPGPRPCYIRGCSSELCTGNASAESDCTWREWYACYSNETCERQANGDCDWILTPKLDRCLKNDTSVPEPCYIGGCSLELCTDRENAQSSCEWMVWYSCYRDAICERQIDGSCGWTETAELKECLR